MHGRLDTASRSAIDSLDSSFSVPRLQYGFHKPLCQINGKYICVKHDHCVVHRGTTKLLPADLSRMHMFRMSAETSVSQPFHWIDFCVWRIVELWRSSRSMTVVVQGIHPDLYVLGDVSLKLLHMHRSTSRNSDQRLWQ